MTIHDRILIDNSERTNQTSKWIHVSYPAQSSKWKCSICGGISYFPFKGKRKSPSHQEPCDYKFCPRCGAEMDVEGGEQK